MNLYKKNWCLLLFFLLVTSKLFSQVHIGAELGLNLSGPIPIETSQYVGKYDIAGRGGFFLETGIAKQAAFRTGIYYDIQLFAAIPKVRTLGYLGALHFISCPFMGVYKAGPFQASLGPEILVLCYTNVYGNAYKIPIFHVGLRTELGLQFSKRFRLQAYASFDFMQLKPYQSSTKENSFNNLSLGLSLAYSFKIFKKKRVIYSPG